MWSSNFHKYETDYILEDSEKDCHLKKDTDMHDSSEIDCIEETSLHANFLQEICSSEV